MYLSVSQVLMDYDNVCYHLLTNYCEVVMFNHSGGEYLTPEEACAILGVSRRTLERYANAGRIRKYRRGIRNVFFRRSEVERLRDELSEIRPEDEEEDE
jgi:excisionase family DNA binding protein